MLILSGGAAVLCGLFLYLWNRTLASLPETRRPPWAQAGPFKWGVPAAALILFLTGILLLAQAGVRWAASGLAAAALAAYALIRFDRYAAHMRVIHARYRSIREAGPDIDEGMALYLTARWRYPDWERDRLVELVAGKNIESLILLMIIRENGVNPISDWNLYRSLREKASRIAGSGSRKR
jgi:hypothetical protein